MNCPENIIFVAFAVANAFRLLAYLPQISVLLRQKDAAAVSSATWLLFTVSNGITAVYAARIVADTAMALTFASNTICCATIVALVQYKRRKIRRMKLGSTPFGQSRHLPPEHRMSACLPTAAE
ncbi:hypothetical protein [Bradyrhizobium cosmicum]|uniref:hypothetical protein n=1 Tax=Bradyrhizobium cosmicum TaxID=1404864 RepID=UPI00116299B7|nr:hypothetical protein [Bradyrhizobium cosmicum]QDP21040.1 hypothetical protein FNV92_02205 [Bradyrhizobium cosmicum]